MKNSENFDVNEFLEPTLIIISKFATIKMINFYGFL